MGSASGFTNRVIEIPISEDTNTDDIHEGSSDEIAKSSRGKQIATDEALLELSKKLDVIGDRLKSMDEEDRVQTEWRAVAMTIDSIIFWVFIAICSLTILACALVIPGYRH